MMKLTVAICTWNRAGLLDKTLTEMHKLRIPQDVGWEIVVVNNNCTDDTDDVIRRHQAALPLRRLFEQVPGHSAARNCALEAATGDLLVWTDDDVLVDPEWLAEYVAAARKWPKATYFGGTIDPWLESEPRGWIRRHWEQIKGIFVIRQYGDMVGPMPMEFSPAGANMAFRTNVLRQFRFDTRLGRVGETLTGADDTDIVARLRQANHEGIWVGTAKVRHFIPAERLTRRYLRRWYVGAGRTQVRSAGVISCATLLGVPRWALVAYIRQWLKMCRLSVFRGDRWFEAFRQSSILWGYMSEARRQRAHNALATNRIGEADGIG